MQISTIRKQKIVNFRYYSHVLNIIAFQISLILLLAFLEKRIEKCLDCCDGRPGLIMYGHAHMYFIHMYIHSLSIIKLVYQFYVSLDARCTVSACISILLLPLVLTGLCFRPINLLDDFEHRWSYAVSFGAITNTIVLLFLRGSAISEDNSTAVNGTADPAPTQIRIRCFVLASLFYGQWLVLDSNFDVRFDVNGIRTDMLYSCIVVSLGLAFSLEVCIAFWPFFACLVTRFKLVGSLIGVCYGSLWCVTLALLVARIECLLNHHDVCKKN